MPPSTEFKIADRSHTSFLAAAEKRALIWMAARLPVAVNSDHLTALGFLSLVAAGGCYWYSRWHPLALLGVIVFLVLNWLGDSLDGTVARVRNRQRPRYGFYVDHILDAIGTVFLMSGLALSGLMTPVVAYAFLVVYLLLSIETYLATYTIGVFQLSHWHFGPTELRILLVAGNLFALNDPYALLGTYRFLFFDAGFAIGAAALTVILIQATVRHVIGLYREETWPEQKNR
jgi:phosphatidylglycerophosphate synthase